MRLLYADPQDGDRALLKSHIENEGGQLLEARDGAEVLEILKTQKPDLILAAILMPKMDGLDLLYAIRSDKGLACLPFVIYDGAFNDQRVTHFAFRQGADDLIKKPTDLKILYPRLQEIANRTLRSPPNSDTSNEPHCQLFCQVLSEKLQTKVEELEIETLRNLGLKNELDRLTSDLKQETQDLHALTEITNNSFSSLEINEMLHLFLKRLVQTLAADSAAVYLLHAGHLRIRASIGLEKSVANHFSVPIGNGVAGTIARKREPLFLEDLRDNTLVVNPEVREQGLVSLSAVPIYNNLEFLGVVQVAWRKKRPYSPRETRLLEITAERCAVAVSNCQLFERTEEIRKHLDLQIERMPIANIVCDPNGIVQSWNPAAGEMFGFSPQEALGRHLLELIQKEGQIPQAELGLTGEQMLKGIQETLTKEGRSIVCEWLNVPLRKPDNTIIGILFMALDITEQRKAEAKLRQAQKMEAIGNLAGGIAHDFNNILSAIIGYATLVRKRLPEVERANIDQVILAGNRATELIKQLLTFSRQTEQKLRPLRVQPILKEALKLLRPIFPATIQIEDQIDENCPSIFADPTQIHQIIMNLSTNAFQAMQHTGGTFRVELRAESVTAGDLIFRRGLIPGDYVVLIFSDTGCGMDAATREKIFEPYFTTKKDQGGTGLGLAMVHGIIVNSGGSISVYSELGKGTTFRIFLPAVNGGPDLADTERVEEVSLPTGTEHLLVVDDEISLANLERQMLEELGYDVTMETSSNRALQLIRKNPERFDLLLTDLSMPGLNGLELARNVREIRLDLPILMATGFSEIQQKEKVKQVGISRLLGKPILLTDLAVAVRQALDGGKPEE